MGFSASEAEPFTQARHPELAEQAKADDADTLTYCLYFAYRRCSAVRSPAWSLTST